VSEGGPAPSALIRQIERGVHIRVTPSEIGRWSPERIRRFFETLTELIRIRNEGHSEALDSEIHAMLVIDEDSLG
jgi:hypothetical protein